MRLQHVLGALFAMLLLAAAPAWAGKLVLTNGTVLNGTVIQSGDQYWIKLPDGTSKTIDAGDVASADLGSSDDGSDSTGAPDTSAAFREAQYRTAEEQTALAAMAIWQEFVDKFPDSPDLPAARQELSKWKKLAADGAEKINGKWVGGDERKQIITRATDLARDAVEMIDHHQLLQAIDKLHQSLKIYPNSFLTNFALGNVAMFQKDYDQAVQYYSTASKLNSRDPDALNNLAVADVFRKDWDAAFQGFVDAAKIQDSQEVAQNLAVAIRLAPSEYRTLPRMKETLQTASLLATQYKIDDSSMDFLLMPIPGAGAGPGVRPDPGDPRTALAWSGTGFFINDQGLILTNAHVARHSKTRLVVMSDGTQVSADIVAIDDQYDLALMHANLPKSARVTCVSLSAEDSPREGADCLVMGFPMINEFGADIKITRGIVSSALQDNSNGADVLTDAKVNPGNSGGPILDKYGHVIAIVCMKSITSGEFDSYGIGISAGHIRDFLTRNKITLTPADAAGDPLATEDIVAKVKPATVCIRCTNY